jgi:2-polyprenyl-6-methoxyphenol hydroxylase-like FAD-dependent oxidoreductase
MKEYDVIIIGARVSGSILATLLGEICQRILVLDRAKFPSDSLSTHFFRWPAFQAFQCIGVYDAVQKAAPHLKNMLNDIDGQVIEEPVKGQGGLDYFLCLRRITLDWILVQRMAQVPTVEFIQGARMQELLRDEERVIGATWQDEHGLHSAKAKVVVGADGVHSRVAKLVKAKFETFVPVRRAMYYTYFKNLEPLPLPTAEHYFRGNHLTYVFPTDDELTLLAITVPRAEFDGFRRNPQGSFYSALESITSLRERLEEAEQAAPIKGAGNIPSYQRVPYGPGWVLVGDAAQIMDPWSGQGIDHASTHAVMLAEAFDIWLNEKSSWEEVMQKYHHERNEWSRKTFERTTKFAGDLRPMTRAALMRRNLPVSS